MLEPVARKQDKVGGTCSMHGKGENVYNILFEKKKTEENRQLV
jgi:hypothetical protein